MFEGIKYPWSRYWIPEGEEPTMDGGYFCDPESPRSLFQYQRSNGVTLQSLNDIPCLILLGDVGMGKSTVISTEAAILGKTLEGQDHKVLFKDLKRLSEDQILRQIFHDQKVTDWKNGLHSLTIFLDSLDECWRRIEELESILVGELQSCLTKQLPPLKIRLTCRSAEWRGNTGKALAQLFSKEEGGPDPVKTLILAPLSKNNIRQASNLVNVDGDIFLDKVHDKGAQVLASHPITFQMLIGLYRQGHTLTNSRVALYEQGCHELCKDAHLSDGFGKKRNTTPRQRFTVAARLAAISVLSNRYLINSDVESRNPSIGVVDIEDISGYYAEETAGQHLAVTRDAMVETLQTALFTERCEGYQSWRHQSYAEFLGAWYISRLKLSDEQIIELITDTGRLSRSLIPQLEETACWLADINPSLFDVLSAENPDVLLRCDPKAWDETKKNVLVFNYLQSIRQHKISEFDWQLRYFFARLNHATLAPQLRSVILDATENILVRHAAIDIAIHCNCLSLAPDLISVFLDKSDVFLVRQRAGFALDQIADSEVRCLLKEKSDGYELDDPLDEFKGYYLKVLWPDRISVAQLLPLLSPPKKTNFLGSYKAFLQGEFLNNIKDDEFPLLLDWLRLNKISFDILGPYGHLPANASAVALSKLDHPQIRAAFINILKSTVDHDLNQLFHELRPETELKKEVRQFFWKAVVESDLEVRKIITYGYSFRNGLLSRTDFPFFIEEYRKETSPSRRTHWQELIFHVYDQGDYKCLEMASHLASEDNAIAETLENFTSCRIVPDSENWLKMDYYRKLNKTPQNRPDTIERLIQNFSRALDEYDKGNNWGFWCAVELLDAEPEDHRSRSLSLKLTDEDVWPLLPKTLRDRLLITALAHLDSQEVKLDDVWDEGKNLRPYSAAHVSFLLLFDEIVGSLDALPQFQWGKWIPVIFAYSNRFNGHHEKAYQYILKLAFCKAPEDSVIALRRFLAKGANFDNRASFLWHLVSAWNPEIRSIVLDLLTDNQINQGSVQHILQLLVFREPTSSISLLEEIFDKYRINPNRNVVGPVSGAILLRHWPEVWAVKVLRVIQDNPEIGESIMACCLRPDRKAIAWVEAIPSQIMAELYLWLEKQFPGNPYDDQNGGSVTAAHEMYHFKSGVFENLRRRCSSDACDAIIFLMEKEPTNFWLGEILAEMRKAVRRDSWSKPAPSVLMKLFSGSGQRLVRSGRDLQRVLIESLRRFENKLRAAPPSMELWNETKVKRVKNFTPKDENNLSTCLKIHFENDLDKFAIIASREVQIRPRLGSDPAELVDLLIYAVPIIEPGQPCNPVSVVVEVKCAWNNGVLEDMDNQLNSRYLSNSTFNYGIYVVAFFRCEAWRDPDDGRRTSGIGAMTIEVLRSTLLQQSRGLSSDEKIIEVNVLDARINHVSHVA